MKLGKRYLWDLLGRGRDAGILWCDISRNMGLDHRSSAFFSAWMRELLRAFRLIGFICF